MHSDEDVIPERCMELCRKCRISCAHALSLVILAFFHTSCSLLNFDEAWALAMDGGVPERGSKRLMEHIGGIGFIDLYADDVS